MTGASGLRLERLDIPVLATTLVLLGLGLFQMASADLTGAAIGPQIRWLVIALVAFPVVVRVSYRRWISLSPLLYAAGIAALVLVLLFAPSINGSKRWLPVLGFGFQPSELMKIGTVLLLARLFRRDEPPWKWSEIFLFSALAGMPAVLILLEPDLGNSLLFLPVLLAILFAGGVPVSRILGLLLLIAVLLACLYSFGLKDYQRERIWSTYHLDRMTPAQRAGPGYQLDQSLIAIGNGGLLGQGRGEGPRTQSGKLPYQHNDFVFSVLAEEQGFVGTTLTLVVFLLLVLFLLRLAGNLRDPEARVMVVGIATLVGTQTLVHAGVTLGMLPTKGLPLPFFSAGGTALFSSLLGIALAQSAALHRARFPLQPYASQTQAW